MTPCGLCYKCCFMRRVVIPSIVWFLKSGSPDEVTVCHDLHGLNSPSVISWMLRHTRYLGGTGFSLKWIMGVLFDCVIGISASFRTSQACANLFTLLFPSGVVWEWTLHPTVIHVRLFLIAQPHYSFPIHAKRILERMYRDLPPLSQVLCRSRVSG